MQFILPRKRKWVVSWRCNSRKGSWGPLFQQHVWKSSSAARNCVRSQSCSRPRCWGPAGGQAGVGAPLAALRRHGREWRVYAGHFQSSCCYVWKGMTSSCPGLCSLWGRGFLKFWDFLILTAISPGSPPSYSPNTTLSIPGASVCGCFEIICWKQENKFEF